MSVGRKSTYDFLIAGAGIVGLTLARELLKRNPKAKIAFLEKEAAPGLHASGRNSGVLHSGIYYSANTLKAKLCAKGARLMKEFAREHGVACQHWGKVIVAASAVDLPGIDRLMKNAHDNGIRATRLDGKNIRELEPHAQASQAGIHCPDTAVIDSKGVVKKLAEILEKGGVDIYFGAAVIGADPAAKKVVTPKGKFSYGYFFNCAGAYADQVARHYGLSEDYTLVPFKGLYYKLNPERGHLVKSSIYPVPDLHLPFLGVHLTRVVSDDVYVGPTAIPALGRENYGITSGATWREALGILGDMAGMYWTNQQNFRRLVHVEVKQYLKPFFLAAARRLVPELRSSDLLPCDKVGIRPQLIHKREKKLELDFIIQQTKNSMHILNAISPAFTSSLAFAEFLADRFESHGRDLRADASAAAT